MTARLSFFHIIFMAGLSLALLSPSCATAQEQADTMPPPGFTGVDILPAKSLSTEEREAIDPEAVTHPELRITSDKSEIIRLDHEAGTVVVGNPAHITVMAENTKTLVISPKAPGATYFTVLDATGNVLMQRHVIVGSPEKKYIRVRKSCAGMEKGDCKATQVYYCPDMCHEIIINEDSKDSKSKATLTEDGSGGTSDGSAQNTATEGVPGSE